MAVDRVHNWVANEILLASDLEAEFNNILNNGESLGFPRSTNADFNGVTLLLDADGDTTLRASGDDQIDIAIGGTDTFQFTATQLTILGKRVLTVRDRSDLMAEIMRLRTAEARVVELESSGFLMSQLNNF